VPLPASVTAPCTDGALWRTHPRRPVIHARYGHAELPPGHQAWWFSWLTPPPLRRRLPWPKKNGENPFQSPRRQARALNPSVHNQIICPGFPASRQQLLP
jgi:hypothetical protein